MPQTVKVQEKLTISQQIVCYKKHDLFGLLGVDYTGKTEESQLL